VATRAAAGPGGWRLAALFAALGAYALIAQTALLRQFLVIFGGNELALGLFFGAWFAGIGAGAAALGRTTERRTPSARGLRILLAVGAILPPLILVAMKTTPVWLRLPPGLAPTWRVVALAGLLCAPLGFWIGAAFPLFSAAAGEADAVGRMFVWEAVGSVGGGLTFSFVLALFTPPISAAAAASTILLLGAAAADWPRSLRRPGAWAAAAALAAFIASPLGDRAEQGLERLRFRVLGSSANFERSIQTRYENVTFSRSGEQTQLFGNGAYLDSFPDAYAHQQEAALLLSLRPAPRRIALLDGGLTGLAGELLRARIDRLDIAYLDAQLTREIIRRLPRAAQAWTGDPRLQIWPADARRFVQRARNRYDLVAVLAPDPSTALLNRLFTREFFAEAKAALTEKGVLVVSLTAAANYVGEEVGLYVGSVYATLRSVFPEVAIFPDDQVWLVAGRTAGSVTADPAALKANYEAAFAGRPPLPPEVIDLYVMPDRIERTKTALAGYPASINRDLRPVSYLAFLRIWDQFAGGRLAGLLAWLTAASRGLWLALAAALAACCVAWPLLGRAATGAGRYGLVSVASSGFCAIGAVIVSSLVYQSLFGQMYQMAAVLFASYMVGLALGGQLAMRWGREKKLPIAGLLAGDAWLAACFLAELLFLPWAVGRPTALVQATLLALVTLTGAGAGVAFPLAAQTLAAQGVAAGRRAGRVDAADHLAAMVGSLLVGVVLLPVVGVQLAFAMMAGLKIASGLGGLLSLARKT